MTVADDLRAKYNFPNEAAMRWAKQQRDERELPFDHYAVLSVVAMASDHDWICHWDWWGLPSPDMPVWKMRMILCDLEDRGLVHLQQPEGECGSWGDRLGTIHLLWWGAGEELRA